MIMYIIKNIIPLMNNIDISSIKVIQHNILNQYTL